MSESALAAAIRPKSNGSSTIGVKKSTVWTSARSSLSANTAASSPDAEPTSSCGSSDTGNPRTIGRRSAAGSLQPQPAPCDREVSATVAMPASVRQGRRPLSLGRREGRLGLGFEQPLVDAVALDDPPGQRLHGPVHRLVHLQDPPRLHPPDPAASAHVPHIAIQAGGDPGMLELGLDPEREHANLADLALG